MMRLCQCLLFLPRIVYVHPMQKSVGMTRNQRFPQDTPSPSQVRAVNSNDPGKLRTQLVPQVDQIQRDMLSRQHELEEAGIERRQMTLYESLVAKSHRNIQNLESD